MRLSAAISWFAFFFAVVATVVTYAAANDSVSMRHDIVLEQEKARVAQQDA